MGPLSLEALAGAGILLALAGILSAAVPGLVRRLLVLLLYVSPERLRLGGVGLAVLGLVLLWFARDGGASP